MHKTRILFLALILLPCCITSSYAVLPRADTIEINKKERAYEVTVPLSRLIMTIPKGGLLQAKNAVNNPHYFYFEDNALGLIISGWFEPEQSFTGIEKFWSDETRAYRSRGIPEPQDVSFLEIGNWNAIVYDMPLPRGSNSNIRAHWLEAGTWIDIHLSISSERRSSENRAQLLDMLKAIQVNEKK